MGAGLTPLRDFLVKDVRRPLAVLLGAVALLLLLACTNVANLMLVRASDRTREVALRFAMGARGRRILRQMLTEGLLLALLGGAVGLALGWVGVRAIARMQPIGITGATTLALDARVVLFTVGVAVASGLLFGLAPALRATRGDLQAALKEGGRGGSTGRGTMRTVGMLVSVEVGLAVLLVVGAGLMVRTFWMLRSVDPGFRTEGVVAVQFGIPSARYEKRDQVLAFQDDFERRMEARPGITRVGLVNQLPLAGTSWSSQFQAEGWPPERVGFEILHRRTDAGYFEALDIPLVRGRMFGPDDGADTPPVVLINETFARQHFPGEDPIGQKIAYDRTAAANPDGSTWYEIIGIVGDQMQTSPADPARAEAFENRDQDWGRSEWFVIRTAGSVASTVAVTREVLHEMDPLIPLGAVRPIREVWRESMAQQAFILTLLGAFGAMALLLAAVGVYGVTAQAARKRTQEIGIRMALGAGASDVVGLMLRQGLAVVALGLAAGLAVALLATRAIATFLYGVEPTDPATLVSVVALLAGVAAVASLRSGAARDLRGSGDVAARRVRRWPAVAAERARSLPSPDGRADLRRQERRRHPQGAALLQGAPHQGALRRLQGARPVARRAPPLLPEVRVRGDGGPLVEALPGARAEHRPLRRRALDDDRGGGAPRPAHAAGTARQRPHRGRGRGNVEGVDGLRPPAQDPVSPTSAIRDPSGLTAMRLTRIPNADRSANCVHPCAPGRQA